jgi:hypothetical protein
MDKHYRAPFFAMSLEDHAVYGENNVLRDHYTTFYEGTSHDHLLRCKHYCIPMIDIRSQDEMSELITRIPARGEGQLYFRGQTSLYTLERPDVVRRLLFGDSCSDEPSLLTAAARWNFDYDSLHFALTYWVQHHLFADPALSNGQRDAMYYRWREAVSEKFCEIYYKVMALAQHYGIPTHGLDVTTSLDVATWFATNKFIYDLGNGTSGYRKLTPDQWPENKEKWPVVFVGQTVTHSIGMSLQDCQELDAFGLTALRPQRQQALFFHGGHGDHQNRMAETLICAFRLIPENYKTRCAFEDIFPLPTADPAYEALLRFSKDEPFFISWRQQSHSISLRR